MAGGLTISVSGNGVNIIHYSGQLYACCKKCRDEEDRANYEMVQKSGSLWCCYQCGSTALVDAGIAVSHIAVLSQNEQLVRWVSGWLLVPEERVKVSIDG